MKATSKSGYGKGWHKESGRHSLARKTGTAGGKYAQHSALYKRVAFDLGNGHQKTITHGLSHITKIHGNLYYDSIKDKVYMRGIDGGFYSLPKDSIENTKIRLQYKEYLANLKDSDGDGVPDHKDCQPHNPNAQDNHRQLAEAYANGETNKRGSRMFIEGKTIYSYGRHFPIAYKLDPDTYAFNKDKYSQSTTRHQNYVRKALAGKKLVELSTEEIKMLIGND